MLQFLLSADEIRKLKKEININNNRDGIVSLAMKSHSQSRGIIRLGQSCPSICFVFLYCRRGRNCSFFSTRCAGLKPAHSSSTHAAPILNFSSSLASGGWRHLPLPCLPTITWTKEKEWWLPNVWEEQSYNADSQTYNFIMASLASVWNTRLPRV